ncbi:N-acetyl-alpha-D-glucosaminyl L-malate synthase BshA [candidate division TA06 bacterium]|uniref:N-acetyl-alpha-D-glucosaminyl L-malate synthase BshA n=1 Tax=candidate division TA06 bacterium TaxID=2250710 RepID=A0A523XQ05_UNCT6|nr:MAG: N-acetyl-alpha-D-glucosaminyl L-malate synthase BshA [candidate division TA06 bacterium]
MRIGISCYPTYGGSGIVASELGKELSDRGHQVHFICYAMPMRLRGAGSGTFYHQVEMVAYPLFSYPPYSLALASKMAEVAKYERLEVLHVHYAIPHAVSAYLARELCEEPCPRVVTTLHGTDITLIGSDSSFLPITKFSIEKSDGVTAVSQYLKKKTEETIGVSTPIEVIYNFINTTTFFRNSDPQIERPAGKVVIHISNFRPVKRIDNVVDVFARIRQELKAVLLLVGDGPERSKAEQMSLSLGISESVRFLGSRYSVRDLLSISDLMLFPSENESFGLAALEAMACEVPVVGTNSGGLPEVVVDGENGYLSDIGDVDSMAESSIEILKDEEKRRHLGKNARERVVQSFDSKNIVPRYEEMYNRVLST